MPVCLTCQHCGVQYKVKPSRATISKFCSRKCKDDHGLSLETRQKIGAKLSKERPERRGPLNPNWKGNNATANTGRDRARHLYAVRQPCQVCGSSAERHHIDGNPLNNAPENIAWLCRRHHQERDGRMAFLKNVMPRMGAAARRRRRC